MIGIVVVAAVVAVLGARTVRISVAGRPLAPIAAGAPAWLVNRPFSAGLSPDLAPQCVTGSCRFALASGADLAAMRSLVGGSCVVHGMRVFDPAGALRGVALFVSDDQADELVVDAVWVPRAPARWDGARAYLTGGAQASRWVLHAASGVWLVQSVAWGCPGGPELATLTGIAAHRVLPARLHL
jgi:hypothetical protein